MSKIRRGGQCPNAPALRTCHLAIALLTFVLMRRRSKSMYLLLARTVRVLQFVFRLEPIVQRVTAADGSVFVMNLESAALDFVQGG